MLSQEIKNINERINRIERKVGMLDGGASYFELEAIKYCSKFYKIEEYINKYKREDDDICVLAGIKTALIYTENKIKKLDIISEIKQETKNKSHVLIYGFFNFYDAMIKPEKIEKQKKRLKFISEQVSDLENKLGLNKYFKFLGF